MDSLNTRLEAEVAKRTQLEKGRSNQSFEVNRLKDQAVKYERELKNLQGDLRDRDWEIKQLKTSQNKTIVEHVHVLQEAKNLTDNQLAEAQKELAKVQARVKQLETTRARMVGEAEDAARQHEKELIALRTNEKDVRGYEEKARRATAEADRERKLKEASEIQSRRLQSDLRTAQGQLSDLEQQLHTVQRAKDSLEADISSLAANNDGTNAVTKMRRDYEARISQLEAKLEDTDMVQATAERIRQKIEQQHADIRRLISSSGPKDNFRETLLKQLKLADDALAAEYNAKPMRSRVDSRVFGNISPSKRSSIAMEANGILRSRRDSQVAEPSQTPDRQASQLRQQVQALELRIVASDRVRQHLESALREMTADLENSDGSKQSLQEHRTKLARENSRLSELMREEAEARRAAEASQMDGIKAMWNKFQNTINTERESYTKLEESRKALVGI